MKILIIGNGFDLAHGLPTKYTDFLTSSQKFFDYLKKPTDDNTVGIFVSDAVKALGANLHDEFSSFKDNVWFNYMQGKYKKNERVGDTWIDFEREVRTVIEWIEKKCVTGGDLKRTFTANSNASYNFFMAKFNKSNTRQISTKEKFAMAISEFLFDELLGFTRAFEIYCLCIIDRHVQDFAENKGVLDMRADISKLYHEMPVELSFKMELDRFSKDFDERHNASPLESKYTDNATKDTHDNLWIDMIKYDPPSKADDSYIQRYENLHSQYAESCLLRINIGFNCVLSFNYTNTFEALYGKDAVKLCYIHGKAQAYTDNTNMIFGIDETLQEDRESKNFLFAKFKKYFQRITKKTGSEYKDWIKDFASVAASADTPHHIYIIGHSLDTTDHEILKEFFAIGTNNSNIKITIFYFDEFSKIKMIEKTIEMIGKDELIRRVHGSGSNIYFIDQYDNDAGIMKRPGNVVNPPCEGFCGIYYSPLCKSCEKYLPFFTTN